MGLGRNRKHHGVLTCVFPLVLASSAGLTQEQNPPGWANLEPGAVLYRNGLLFEGVQYQGHIGIFWFYDARADEYRVLQASGPGIPVGPRNWTGFVESGSFVGSLGPHPHNTPPGVRLRDDLIYSALYHAGANYAAIPLQTVCGNSIDCDRGNVAFQTRRSCSVFDLFDQCSALRCDGFADLVYRDNNILLYDSWPNTPGHMYGLASDWNLSAVPPKPSAQVIDAANGLVTISFDEPMSKYSLFDDADKSVSIEASGSEGSQFTVELVEYSYPQRAGGAIMDFLYWFDPNPIYADWHQNYDFDAEFDGPQWPCVYYPDGWGSLPTGSFKFENRHDVNGVTVQVLGSGIAGEIVTVTITDSARDLGGNRLQSGVDGASVEYVLGGVGPDITAPTVSITDPFDGQRLEDLQSTIVRVTAADNEGIDRVEFFADGVLIGDDNTPSDDPPSYSAAWILNDYFGQVLLQAKAFDLSGNYATDSIVVTVDREATSCGIASFGTWDLEEIGDGDGVIERGESAEVRVPVTATGGFMNDTVAALIPNVPGFIEEPDNLDDLGGFTQGQSKTAGSFLIDIPNLLPQSVEFRLALAYNDGSTSCLDEDVKVFSFPQQGTLVPAFTVCEIHLVEDDPSDAGENNGNGTLENGEDAAIRFSLRNTGSADATNVRARPLGFGTTNLQVDTNFENFGDIVQGNCIESLTDTWDLFADRSLPPGTYTSDIEITYDGAPQPVILNGALQITVEPEAWIVVSPQSSDFGVVAPGETVEVDFELINDGTETLTVTGVTHSGPDTSLTISTPFTVGAGSSRTVTVQIDTTNLSGAISRETVFETDGRVRDLGEDDTARMSGSVSASYPVFSTGNPAGSEDPEVGGGLVAWTDERAGDRDIWGFDLDTGEMIPLVVAEGDQWDPRIDGDWLAWEDTRGGSGSGSEQTYDVRAKHLPTGAELIVADSSLDERLVGLDGDYIAFLRGYVDLFEDSGDFSRRCYNLFIYRISDGTTTAITNFTHSGTADAPTISSSADFQDGFLVWEQFSRRYQNGRWSTIVNPLLRRVVVDSTCSSIDFTPDTLVTNYNGNSDPSTTGCRIVWEQDAPAGCGDEEEQIMLWQAGNITQVTPNFSCENAEFRNPVLSGDIITYEKVNRSLPGRPRYLAMRSLSTGEETIISTSTPYSRWRMDDSVVAWEDGPSSNVLFSFLGMPDFAVSTAGLQIPSSDIEGAPIQATVTVTNNTPLDTGDSATLRLYAGESVANGIELASASVPALGPASSTSVSLAAFELAEEGIYSLLVVVESSLDEYKGNNKASTTISVSDDDSSPPVISDLLAEEHLGDGDGIIEPGEAIRVSWSASDPKSIRESSASIDGIQRLGTPIGNDRFESLYAALNEGTYPVIITACDDDNSPSCTTLSGTLVVEVVDPACPGDLNMDGVKDLEDIVEFVIRFQNQDPSVDCGRVGVFDLEDIICFVTDFQIICE
jgi:hypothetical protein